MNRINSRKDPATIIAATMIAVGRSGLETAGSFVVPVSVGLVVGVVDGTRSIVVLMFSSSDGPADQ